MSFLNSRMNGKPSLDVQQPNHRTSRIFESCLDLVDDRIWNSEGKRDTIHCMDLAGERVSQTGPAEGDSGSFIDACMLKVGDGDDNVCMCQTHPRMLRLIGAIRIKLGRLETVRTVAESLNIWRSVYPAQD